MGRGVITAQGLDNNTIFMDAIGIQGLQHTDKIIMNGLYGWVIFAAIIGDTTQSHVQWCDYRMASIFHFNRAEHNSIVGGRAIGIAHTKEKGDFYRGFIVGVGHPKSTERVRSAKLACRSRCGFGVVVDSSNRIVQQRTKDGGFHFLIGQQLLQCQ